MAQSLFKSYAMMLRANNAKPNLVKGYAQLALMNNCRSRPLLEQSQPYCSSRSLEKSTVNISDEIQFSQTQTPVLLNAQTHAVGYLSRILNAQVYDIAVETPLQPAINMSKMLKNDIFFKREDQQPVFSFKIRGAYNKIASLTEDQLARGIVACSAGNHAQGVALSAARLGARAVIVMPLATPGIKVSSVRNFGGGTVEVRLHGANYDEAAAEAKRLEAEEGMTMVHPFDDPLVIAGQGTIGMEIVKSMTGRPLDAVFVCCGGGGMLAGVAAYIKRVRPDVKVIGVEAEDAAGMTASLMAGEVVSLPQVGLFADGAAVKTVGRETFRICSRLVDEMVTVSTDEICQAIKLGFNDSRTVLEPAGALAIAGCKKYIEINDLERGSFVCTLSGANMDFNRLRFVSERADTTENLICVTIPERKGAFKELYECLHPRPVTEFSYRYRPQARGDAVVLLSFQSPANEASERQADVAAVLEKLNTLGWKGESLEDNELAKVHVRHMAGGRAPSLADERLYSFSFPEGPGALKNFLDKLRGQFNVSLFHYRNHGDDFGRVLVGFTVPEEDLEAFGEFLEELGYRHTRETGNTAYQQFLV
uniref:Threonine dehydratase n=1 Tax=Heterosigma akashiwo TaxID=2829 RepID=A0A6S9HDM6_HETAK|mmetsp:Transcript_56078/g.82027  ORF Transcript_56078/g.82027 Transcript_56078/m.82027 type:complete len:592 (+) Transcript_56078:102-1877(+)